MERLRARCVHPSEQLHMRRGTGRGVAAEFSRCWPAAYARLPLQAPLIWWALRVAGQAGIPAESSSTQR
jgi:uncharacterized membrane protein